MAHPIFDNETRWDANFPCPIDLTAFQKRLDEITGKTWDGRSRLRVVWGQAPDDLMFFRGEKIRRHPHWREKKQIEWQDEETGLWTIREQLFEIGIPRFYVQELHERDELLRNDAWEQSRYSYDGLTKIDDMGPVPEEGFYQDLFLVAHHDSFCCNGAGHVRGVVCLGGYRPPSQEDIDRVGRMIRRWHQATPEELEPSLELKNKRIREHIQKQEREQREALRETVKNGLAPHQHTFTTDDPSIAQWGKYHWVGAHNKSGAKPKDKIIYDGNGA